MNFKDNTTLTIHQNSQILISNYSYDEIKTLELFVKKGSIEINISKLKFENIIINTYKNKIMFRYILTVYLVLLIVLYVFALFVLIYSLYFFLYSIYPSYFSIFYIKND